MWSRGSQIIEGNATGNHYLTDKHLSLLDWDRVFFAIEQLKNERSWYNMEISSSLLQDIMKTNSWYSLTIPEESLAFHDYGTDISRWEEITIALLRAYIDRAYSVVRVNGSPSIWKPSMWTQVISISLMSIP